MNPHIVPLLGLLRKGTYSLTPWHCCSQTSGRDKSLNPWTTSTIPSKRHPASFHLVAPTLEEKVTVLRTYLKSKVYRALIMIHGFCFIVIRETFLRNPQIRGIHCPGWVASAFAFHSVSISPSGLWTLDKTLERPPRTPQEFWTRSSSVASIPSSVLSYQRRSGWYYSFKVANMSIEPIHRALKMLAWVSVL